MINVEQLMLDLKELQQDMIERCERAHADTKSHVVDSDDWNFHVGQLDVASTARWKIAQLIEKYS